MGPFRPTAGCSVTQSSRQNSYRVATKEAGLSHDDIKQALLDYFVECAEVKRILIVPPDISRSNSYAGPIVELLCRRFPAAEIDILPALGTHMPMSAREIRKMYGGVPADKFMVHDWRHDTVAIGRVSSSYMRELSENQLDYDLAVDVSRHVLNPDYDLVISVGQVVPHEVAGFANYTKNILVGCGGSNMIGQSHYLGALHGMERIMGRADNPVRSLYNYAAREFLDHVPIVYILTVTTLDRTGLKVEGLSIGKGDELFVRTAALSAQKNMTFLEQPIKKAVVYLDPEKFKTTWVGNKAIYRTRMAIADGGELLIMAPALEACGEDLENDRLIKKFGYLPRGGVLAAVKGDRELGENLAVAAHLIHGSSEGRFKITYAPGKMSREQMVALKYDYMRPEVALAMYDVEGLREGFNIVQGEEIFFVSNPALGLWTTRERFNN